MGGFASATAARLRSETATRQRQRRAGKCRSRRPNFSSPILFSCYCIHVGKIRSCPSYFSYPRGYDMTSNKTYSYPYSTHKRYPFSVCRKPLMWLAIDYSLTVSWAKADLYTGGASSSQGSILVASIMRSEHSMIIRTEIRTRAHKFRFIQVIHTEFDM
jgi:hypothetical protein